MTTQAPRSPPPARAATAVVRRWGGALVLRIPEDVASDLNVLEGDVVEFRVRKRR